MRKYQWNSHRLRGKSRGYDRLALALMVLMVVCLFGFNQPVIALVVAIIGMVVIVLSWKAQYDDKKLKKEGK